MINARKLLLSIPYSVLLQENNKQRIENWFKVHAKIYYDIAIELLVFTCILLGCISIKTSCLVTRTCMYVCTVVYSLIVQQF